MRTALVLIALWGGFPAVLGGQEPDAARPHAYGWAGGALQYARATGEFASYVRDGGGLNGWFAWRGGGDSPLGLRVHGQLLVYGSQTRRYPLVPGINVDVTTSNIITGLTVGPQFRAGEGAAALHMFAGIGFNYFATTSEVEGSANPGQPFASSTNYDDFGFAAEAGGGLQVRLKGPVFLDLGARYVFNGEVTYVTRDRIQVVNNQLVLSPVTSQANLAVFHVGVTVAINPYGGERDRESDRQRD
jgi:hypothetical protein